jgi:hypothetical protein
MHERSSQAEAREKSLGQNDLIGVQQIDGRQTHSIAQTGVTARACPWVVDRGRSRRRLDRVPASGH